MATKTIALDITVYDRLAASKRGGESFSEAIDRLLAAAAAAKTGADILRQLEPFAPLPENEAKVFLAVVAEDRAAGDWERPLIGVDTTFLVDLWRTRGEPDDAAAAVLSAYPGDMFSVPTHAAGEFLEGGAAVSPGRLDQSLAFLRAFMSARWTSRPPSVTHGSSLICGRRPISRGDRSQICGSPRPPSVGGHPWSRATCGTSMGSPASSRSATNRVWVASGGGLIACGRSAPGERDGDGTPLVQDERGLAQEVDPVPPEGRDHDERDQADDDRWQGGHRELTPLAPHHEPEKPDGAPRLGEEDERPYPWVVEARATATASRM
jgi:predicted CopG family antitoxin